MHSEESVRLMLQSVGVRASQPMLKWLSELLLPDETLLDARMWKDELLAFSEIHILHLELKDRGEQVKYYGSYMLRTVSAVWYTFDGYLKVSVSGDQLTVGRFGEFGSLAPFLRTLIGTVNKAGMPA